ncbi:hypothetical protein M0802_000398 [Mischocyttarus mexicanus]|nr:hypothetical protein M0802_000398 [Mischocyttarus mexicanus]
MTTAATNHPEVTQREITLHPIRFKAGDGAGHPPHKITPVAKFLPYEEFAYQNHYLTTLCFYWTKVSNTSISSSNSNSSSSRGFLWSSRQPLR